MEQRTYEWHEFRRSKIGASDAPPIMGVSPWKTAYQLFEEKMEFRTHQINSVQTLRGINLEPEALRKFEELTGYLMSPKVIIHPTIEYMMASLDGLELEGKAIVEIKCPGQKDHQYALDGQVPEKYIPQLQHQLEVSGLQKMYYFSYNVTSWKIIEVYKDENYINNLLKKEKEFFECITNKTPPQITDEEYKEMGCENWKRLSNEWKSISHQIKTLEKKREFLKKDLLCLASDSKAKGNGVSVSKFIRRGVIDIESLPKEKQLDLEEYRKPNSESWRITINEM